MSTDATPIQDGYHYDGNRMIGRELSCPTCNNKLGWAKPEDYTDLYEYYADCCGKRYTLAALLYVADIMDGF